MVGPGGFEPPTSRLSGVHSNHLSYGPMHGAEDGIRTRDPRLGKAMLYH